MSEPNERGSCEFCSKDATTTREAADRDHAICADCARDIDRMIDTEIDRQIHEGRR